MTVYEKRYKTESKATVIIVREAAFSLHMWARNQLYGLSRPSRV